MFDERVHTAEGSFQGREPVGGVFHEIEEYLHAMRDSLPLYWEPPSLKRIDRMESVESTHLGLDRGHSQVAEGMSYPASEA